jgi:cytochrome b561
MIYSRWIRVLHALLAIAITFQLGVSLVMSHPSPKRPMPPAGALYFRWHEWVGLFALAVLVAGWAYRVIAWKRASQARLFPWITLGGLRALMREARDFLSLRWTRIPQDGALAGTAHGMGLLLVTAMAVSGGLIYWALGPNDTVTPTVRSVGSVHAFLATFTWVYLCGHAAMALWHQYAGHATLVRMFRLSER